MKQPIPEESGLAVSESLYSSGQEQKTTSNLANPFDTINIFGRPSLTPRVEYPISEKEEQLLDAAYQHGYNDSTRHNNEYDPMLDVMRERVEQIRKEKIKKGLIKPATKQERKWRLGL